MLLRRRRRGEERRRKIALLLVSGDMSICLVQAASTRSIISSATPTNTSLIATMVPFHSSKTLVITRVLMVHLP
jgi:hypothetical protein